MTSLDVVGLDLSLTGTGLAVIGGPGVITSRLEPPDGATGHARIDWIRAAVADRAHWPAVALAVIEGPSYNSGGGLAHERAGLWWIITRMLWRGHVPYAVVAPATLKKYATGRGKDVKKAEVVAAATRRYPSVELASDDEADALILAAMGTDHLGHPLAEVPKTHRGALTAVRWPTIPAQGHRT